jgi:two-component system response regulator RegA
MQKFKSVDELVSQLKPEKPIYCIRKKSIQLASTYFRNKFPGKILYAVKTNKPGFAVVDLRLADGNGLEVVKEIQVSNPTSRIIMLTGYGNIPTAVAAIKEGAIDYLAKPADADDVEKALLADPEKKAEPPENPMSADRVKWEHIHRVFELCNRNVSETARRLKMHRRTLQRILSKRSPR